MGYRICLFLIVLVSVSMKAAGQEEPRFVIDLNGEWEFDQTTEAFPPRKFTRKCPVPGLVHLARPKIDQYEVYFNRPERSVSDESHNLMNMDYTPKYSWYRREVYVPAGMADRQAVIMINKSQYVTQVFVNRMDVGQSMACYTPIEFNITHALKSGENNEIMIRVGDRAWLPSQAAGSTDKEKIHYLPGIWDDVAISFTDRLRINRALILPSLENKKIGYKVQVRSYFPPQMEYGDPMYDSCEVEVKITDPETGRVLLQSRRKAMVKRDNLSVIEGEIAFRDLVSWEPDRPKLYQARVVIRKDGKPHDQEDFKFGIRDFNREGKYFYLNGEKTYLRGTNITLQRFFEDPDCGNLVWDREWVKKLLIDIPKELQWNAMRICVGIVPDFWYDLADEYGIMFQNEWFYWQNHGWNDQVRAEYTDWVWSDGNHPSIVIWDAINENWDPFIGNTLIPELKQLDPTRIWDAGYMTASDMVLDEMDEPHPYRAGWSLMVSENVDQYLKKNPYYLGDLNDWPDNMQHYLDASAAQLVNEYGWIWLWRDGQPAKLTKSIYDYILGENATPRQRRELNAYWLQLETEWLRSERSFAGILSFCYLANNYGYTGDWFINDIADLEEGPTLGWFRHCFAPQAVFINMPDQRYMDNGKFYKPGEKLAFNLVGINDASDGVRGTVVLDIIGEDGTKSELYSEEAFIQGYGKEYIPVIFNMPEKTGGYLIRSTFSMEGRESVISRRYVRVGEGVGRHDFYEIKPGKGN